MSFLLVDLHYRSPKCPSPAFLQSGLLLPMPRAETPDEIRKTKQVPLKHFTAQPHRFQPPKTSKAGRLSFRSHHPFVVGCGLKRAHYALGRGRALSSSTSPSHVLQG